MNHHRATTPAEVRFESSGLSGLEKDVININGRNPGRFPQVTTVKYYYASFRISLHPPAFRYRPVFQCAYK